MSSSGGDEAEGEEYPGAMLQQAAIYNNLEFMASLLQGDHQQYVNARDSFGRTALYTSVTNNSLECGHMLLQAGADPNMQCGAQCNCMSALHVATLENKQQFVSMLLQAGADITLEDSSGHSAIVLAEEHRSEECLVLLRAHQEEQEQSIKMLQKSLFAACMRGDLLRATELAGQMSPGQVREGINDMEGGQNSTLHRACERNDEQLVDFLLSRGATVHVHPVTGFSPLHSACANGATKCAKILLENFPELIQAPTIDGTLPLHIAASGRNLQLVNIILHFPYPEAVHKIFKEGNGERVYRLGFNIHAKDGHGRTPLHLACIEDHCDIVSALVKFSVKVSGKCKEGLMSEFPVPKSMSAGAGDEDREASTDTLTENEEEPPLIVEEFHPVMSDIDTIDLDGNTPLHLAVKGNGNVGFHNVAKVLLQHKANPNKPIITPSGNSTPLMEACMIEDALMVDLLMKFEATDDKGTVLQRAVESLNEELAGVFLKHKSHLDTEHKINRQALVEALGRLSPKRTEACAAQNFKSIWPSSPVGINWHGLRIPYVAISWLVEACYIKNGFPAFSVSADLCLLSITRIDLSKNNLTQLPCEIFLLPSLHYLNASDNSIKWIPGCEISIPRSCSCFSTRFQASSSSSSSPEHDNLECVHKTANQQSVEETDALWNCPYLEKINFDNNKLKSLPKAIFRLPKLRELTIKHNELESLPFEMWTSPVLTDLNLAHNKLRELSFMADGTISRCSSAMSTFEQLDNIANPEPVHFMGSQPSTPKRQPAATQQKQLSQIGERTEDEINFSAQKVDPFFTVGSSNLSNGVRGQFEDVPVNIVSYWKGKIKIKANPVETHSEGAEKISKLIDLNLSHNQFEKVPEGLACLAPALSQLNLSNNRLQHVGPLECYPAGIKWLDLSHNDVSEQVIPQTSGDDRGRYCFSPAAQTRQRMMSLSKPTTPLMVRSRNNSAASLQSLAATSSSQSGGPVSCPHRGHNQLVKLKTLKLHNNKLARLVLSVVEHQQGLEELESSTESLTATEKKNGTAGPRGSISSQGASNSPEHKHASLLYPNLCILDVSDNFLHSLCVDVKDLLQLSELKIRNNKLLKELPTQMGLLKKLWNLDFSGCPVERVLQAILGEKHKKTAAVLGYLKSIQEEARLYNRMKLMFVGVQGIGKTSLLSQMRKEGKCNSRNKNWAQRMGHSGIKDKDLKGENISTVGVDISDLVLQRGNKEVILRTWDFGGQREYYATHQYFLSKRSLYLVVWKVTDGEKGVEQIHQWLVNIQARAPNSPVIIVGTHMDLITKKKYPQNYLNDLQRLIFERYMKHTEPDKCGLPRVVGSIEVSSKSRIMFNNRITDLVNLILNTCCEERVPGSRDIKLLDQKVPASYLYLQDVVGTLALERMNSGKDPVLHAEQYKLLVSVKMEELHSATFRDLAELNQATQFLHENGVLLHYDDVNLQDVYFLDPQWLCDVLANVVTIREINSLAKCGIMRTDDLKILFKNAAFKPEDIKTYIIDLLNKFEVALMWDSHNLLIPSLLPTEEDMNRARPHSDIRIPVKGVGINSGVPRIANEPVVIDSSKDQDDSAYIEAPADISSSMGGLNPQITANFNPATSLVRLYLMSYFPSGFWPRLITRLLADETFHTIAMGLYELPDILTSCCDEFTQSAAACPEWKCWQSGVELKYLGVTLLRLKEAPWESPNTLCDYRQCSLVIQTDRDTSWNALNVSSTSILEILIPNESITICLDAGSESITVKPYAQVVASLLTKIVDHVDTLLEDWYPDLGARFVQNSKGMYLITRIVPCSRCLLQQIQKQREKLQNSDMAWNMVDVGAETCDPQITQPILIDQNRRDAETDSVSASVDTAGSSDMQSSVDSYQQQQSVESGGIMNSVLTGVESLYSKTAEATGMLPAWNKSPSSSSPPSPAVDDDDDPAPPSDTNLIYCYLLEQCLRSAQENKIVFCPPHGNLGPFFIASADGHIQAGHVAPDSVFQDIGDQYLVDQDLITRGHFLGKGAFGAVYAGNMLDQNDLVPIAMKMMQPVKPGTDASVSIMQQYQAEKKRWDKDPMKHACEAYLNARKELTILLTLHHEHIVPLLGVSLHPLCLLLSLAPQGALSSKLMDYQRVGAKLPVYAIKDVVVQVAGALEYLHSCQIIYRDLKSENVLVWSFPLPHTSDPSVHPARIKLADYGVSRSVLPSGTKGLAGTPPFIAPEIIQHNGEESYTEKVDCFSFGMFLYELFVLKLPFEGEASTSGGGGANLKSFIMQGGRPPLTLRDMNLPSPLLDLMCLCWSHDPADRPSATEILQLASTPECANLYHTAPLQEGVDVTAAASAPSYALIGDDDDMYDLSYMSSSSPMSDVWLAVRTADKKHGELLVYNYREQQCVQAQKISLGKVFLTTMCVTDEHIWCGDTAATVHIYSLYDYCEKLSFPATKKPGLSIKCITYSAPEQQVYLILDRGLMIVCDSVLCPKKLTSSNTYTPVKTECHGNPKEIFSMVIVSKTPKDVELWCGEEVGRIGVWDFKSGSKHTLLHADKTDTTIGDVIFTTTQKTSTVASTAAVWTYLYPGSIVYRWEVASRSVSAKLDVAKVIPAGVTLSARVMDNNTLKSNKSTVCALSVSEEFLFLGTTWGCLLVVDKVSMRPVSCVSCHADESPYIKAVLPLTCLVPDTDGGGAVAPAASEKNTDSYSAAFTMEPSTEYRVQSLPVVVTVGKGHKDLVGRYIPRHSARWDSSPKNQSYLLSWEARHWKHTGQMNFIEHKPEQPKT